MNRRTFITLGAITGGTFALGGLGRTGGRVASAQPSAVPVVDRLVMTNVVDNLYDVFAKGGKLDTIAVQRTVLVPGGAALLAEHGLAYHLESTRGSERREVLLDFSLTEPTLVNNYRALAVDSRRGAWGALRDPPSSQSGRGRAQGEVDDQRQVIGVDAPAGPDVDDLEIRADQAVVDGDPEAAHGKRRGPGG